MTDTASAPPPPASHAPLPGASPSPPDAPIQFAYWVPNVSGGLVISKIAQRTSWDIDYNRSSRRSPRRPASTMR